jgi:hypothetical protein
MDAEFLIYAIEQKQAIFDISGDKQLGMEIKMLERRLSECK